MEAPSSLIWLVTGRCNLACSHCYAQRFRGLEELSTEEAIALVAEAGRAGVTHLGLTGGEPLLRPDIQEIVMKARSYSLGVSLVTSGTPVTPSVARELAGQGVSVVVSLDGARPQTHDRRRGEGAYDHALAAVRYFREAGISCRTVMAMGQDNYTEVEGYVELAHRLDARSACLIPIMPSGGATQDDVLSSPQVVDTLRLAAKRAEKLGIELHPWCLPFAPLVVPSLEGWAGSCRVWRSMDIGPAGNVLLCDVLDTVVASVRDGGLMKAWDAQCRSKAVRRLENPTLPGVCATCSLSNLCRGGCYARAQLISGDLYGPDPLCPKASKIPSGAPAPPPSL